MKRVITLIIVFIIALASVCWADNLTGTWELDHMGMIAPNADPEELKDANETLNNKWIQLNTYLTARSDGTMVYAHVLEDMIDVRIGEWYKYAPDKYVFMYSFSTVSGEGQQHIYYFDIANGILEFPLEENEEYSLIYYLNKVEEE